MWDSLRIFQIKNSVGSPESYNCEIQVKMGKIVEQVDDYSHTILLETLMVKNQTSTKPHQHALHFRDIRKTRKSICVNIMRR